MGGAFPFEELLVVGAVVADELESIKGLVGIFEGDLMFFGLGTNG